MAERVQLLETTLRDGSFSVGFQFTAADTAFIAGMLDRAGISHIELGHGTGSFNHLAPAKYRSKVPQGATDEEYLAAARAAAPRAKLGVITGSFAIDGLKLLAAHRFDFVRIGVMADDALNPANLAMAEAAKSLGLIASINLMQTVALSPAQVGEVALAYERIGADWLYIVDSAGGLLPSRVREYVRAVRDVTAMRVGLHAHHNTGLAVANCLAAVEAGATLVDSTIQGLGREVGNAPTEQLLMLLRRLGHEREVDVEPLCQLGDLVRGLIEAKGSDPTYFAAGAAELHSANLPAFFRAAQERKVAPRSLLCAVGDGSERIVGYALQTFPERVMAPAFERAVKAQTQEPSAGLVEAVGRDVERSSASDLAVVASAVYARAAKHHKESVLHLVPADRAVHRGPLPWETERYCGVTLPVAPVCAADLGAYQPSILLVDPGVQLTSTGAQRRSPLRYGDLVTDAARLTAAACLASGSGSVWVAGLDADQRASLGQRVDGAGAAAPRVQIADPAAPWSAGLKRGDVVVLAGPDAVGAQVAELAGRGIRVVRPALGHLIGATVTSLVELGQLLGAESNGATLIGPLAAPAAGQIVVDDPLCPSTIVELGDGERGPAVRAVAEQRARSLVNGRGSL